MAAFYDTFPFVVQPEKESSGLENYWNILNPGGVKLAVMHHTRDPWPVRLLRAAGVQAQFGTRIAVEDLQGRLLLEFRKGFTLGRFRARVFDADGPLGTVTEQKLGLEGRQYVLTDREGRHRGTLEGDWRSYNLQMRDARGAILGRISRKSEEVNKVIFSEKTSFYVVHLYVDQDEVAWRKLLLGASAAIALLLR